MKFINYLSMALISCALTSCSSVKPVFTVDFDSSIKFKTAKILEEELAFYSMSYKNFNKNKYKVVIKNIKNNEEIMNYTDNGEPLKVKIITSICYELWNEKRKCFQKNILAKQTGSRDWKKLLSYPEMVSGLTQENIAYLAGEIVDDIYHLNVDQ